jgi:UDP-N-acetylglucosamine 1-carboxyvinyltransferase
MAKFLVHGPATLSGEIEPIGNKNAVLKLIPASIIFKGDYELTNVPGISDVDVMLQILEEMGARVNYYKEEKRVVINTDGLNTYVIPPDLAQKVRASVLFYGPLLARFGKVEGNFPGGDKIGLRELKAHFASLMQLGVEFSGDEWGKFTLSGKPQAGHVHLYEPSVTATENVILAAATANGTTTISGAACEPHVQEMCTLLADNGVQIQGIGSNVLHITGKPELSTEGKSHAIWADYLDVCAFVVAAAITNSEIKIKNVRPQDLTTIEFFYNQLGVKFNYQGNDLLITKDQELQVQDPVWARVKGVYSQPWYGFPTDLMSLTIVLGMFTKGTTLFFEKLFPDRMAFTNYLEAAGANIVTADQRRIVVTGPNTLKPITYKCPDIRAGMAYFLASLATPGTSTILDIEHIDRGYPNTDQRYNSLGANVERID